MMGEVFKEWYEESPDFLDSGCFENEVTEEINDNNYISSDVVTEYLNSIKYFEVLTPAEEREYALQIRSGDQDARKKLIEHNAKLVIHAAKKRSNRSPLEFADLIQAGNIGLVQAVDKFDPDKGRFSTFAMHWIIASMKRTEENFARPIRLPSYMVQIKTKVNKVKEQLRLELGREPTAEEIAEATGCNLKSVQAVLEADYRIYSLNNFVGEEKEDEGLEFFASKDNVEDTIINDIMSTVVSKELREIITKKLLKIEQKVIMMKYFQNCTIEVICDTLHLSKKLVKEIEKDGLAKIKKYCLLKDFRRVLRNQDTLYCNIYGVKI
jgi:RNA polymerase sigma factor (sigma-70 family)